jgi:hypothetical protein
MPGNQVGGVLGDQPVQAPGPRRLTSLAHFAGGIAATRQHALLTDIGNKAPDQDALAILRLDLLDGAILRQAGAYQLWMVDRQQRDQTGQAAFAEQGAQRCIELQRLRLGTQQQRRPRRCWAAIRSRRRATRQVQQLHQQLTQPG